MKCNKCGYEHGWSSEQMAVIDGEEGSFYTLPIKAERQAYLDIERKKVIACPSCGNIQIEIH